MNKLSENEILKLMKNIPLWKRIGDKIERDFIFANFSEGINFVNKVAKLAEENDHHPDICIFNYRNVKVMLTTHSLGGLSLKDFTLAEQIEKVF
ncbi:MAG: 4a-hydroxytetrahydrobiopterin dehydratase [Ignavibacteria bacterium]|nr:4a-hydroxytetrahydrobiopterin dehydratase [Ignavibacteria bacterium]